MDADNMLSNLNNIEASQKQDILQNFQPFQFSASTQENQVSILQSQGDGGYTIYIS